MEEFQELKSLYISDPSEAVQKSQELICSVTEFSSFKDFYNYHLENSHISTCQNEWSEQQMSIHCNDCAVEQQSCICLHCFLSGNHQGHDIRIRGDSIGNCDCGDSSLWKNTGFCSKHKGLEENSHPEEYLDEKLRNLLTDTIFKAAFSSLEQHFTDDGSKISIIFQFLMSFLKFGDGFRRLLTISLTEKIDFEKLFYGIIDASITFNKLFQHFCGLLVNDQVFKVNFARVNYKIMIEKVAPKEIEFTCSSEENNLQPWESFWFHSYNRELYQKCIDHNGWDWVNFAIEALKLVKEPIKFIGNPDFNNNIPSNLQSTLDLSDCAEIRPDKETQNLLDRLFEEILTKGTSKGVSEGVNDTNIITSFKKEEEEGFYGVLFYFNYIFYEISDCFKKKKSLNFEKAFKVLDENIDISKIFMPGKNVVEINDGKNDNDNFIQKLITVQQNDEIDNNYNSFHNGAAFYISNPMLSMLANIIRMHDICRLKIASLLGSKKYEGLRVRLGIVNLKSILALVCTHQSLIRKINFGAIRHFMQYVNNPLLTSFGVSLFIPLMQMILGVQTNESECEKMFSLKEFFAFEMAREIGLFDKLDSEQYEDEDAEENENQMVFAFLYLSLLFVIERTLFNFDSYKFIEEQIIFALKKGLSNMNEIRQMCDRKIELSGKKLVDINKIIAVDGTPRQKANKNDGEKGGSLTLSAGDQDVSYDLKEGVENKPISAINNFNDEKVIMNNEIKKHPNNLLHIQNFEDESTYFFKKNENEEDNDDNNVKIHLKEFLMTPTVIAIVYKTLRKSDKLGLNDHLALNLLVLISKFVTESEEPVCFDEKVTIDYGNTYQLIDKLKHVIFKYKEGGNDTNATITNTLNRKSFNALLKVKITLDGSDPKSFIDIIAAKGEVGKKVLSEMAVDTGSGAVDESDKRDQIAKQKKMKARKMKDEIMSHFKNINYNLNSIDFQSVSADDIFTPSPSTEGETCSICSTFNRNEVLSYPLYIYKTKFPFIIDKPPHVSMFASEAIGEREVFEDDEIEDGNDEEEENDIPDIPDVNDIISDFIESHPEIDPDEEGITEEVKQQRINIIGMIKNQVQRQIMEQINEHLLAAEERKQSKMMRLEKKKQQEEAINKLKENPNQEVVRQLTPGNLFVIQFGICQHLVHHTCVPKEDFTCPIDRSFRNGFLPNIADLSRSAIFSTEKDDVTAENLNDNLKAALEFFIDKFSLFFVTSNDKIVDVFVELIKSLSGVIVTYEVRLRNLPDCLDSRKNLILARNLFLTAWYSYRMRGKPQLKTGFKGDRESDNVEKRLTLFQRFVLRLLMCDEIESDFAKKQESLKTIVESFVKEVNDKHDLFLFLRRVTLANHFLLKQDDDRIGDTPFIDWDELLSPEFIAEKFAVDLTSIEGFEFPPFRFADLPKNFLLFGAPPFCFPVEKTRKCSVFSILDYNYMIKNYFDNEKDKKEITIDEKMAENQKQLYKVEGKELKTFLHVNFSPLNYPSILLFIGEGSTTVLIIDGRKFVFLRPFYLDKYGSSDVGYVRGQQVFLNDERYERVIDEILSGDFSNQLKDF